MALGGRAVAELTKIVQSPTPQRAVVLSRARETACGKHGRAQRSEGVHLRRRRTVGNVALFTGNTAYCQVRFEGNRQIACYKNLIEDPLAGVDNERATGLWCANPTNRPENLTIGVATRRCGLFAQNNHQFKVVAQDPLGLLGGVTGLFPDPSFGDAPPLFPPPGHGFLGYENDGCEFTIDDGSGPKRPVPMQFLSFGAKYEPTGKDGTPTNFTILAVADLTQQNPAQSGDASQRWRAKQPGWATLGYFTNIGTVFTAACTEWAVALTSDPNHATADKAISTITKAVINFLKITSPRAAASFAAREFPPVK